MSATVMPVLASALVTAEEAHTELPMPAWVFGVTGFAVFLLLLGITWSFRNTWSRSPRRTRGAGGGHH